MRSVFLALAVTFTISSFSWGYDYIKVETSPTGKEEILNIDTCQISRGYNTQYNIYVPAVTINYEACVQSVTQKVGYTKRHYWPFDDHENIKNTQTYSAEPRRNKKTFELDSSDLYKVLGVATSDQSLVNTKDFSNNLMLLLEMVSKKCSDFVWNAKLDMAHNQGRCDLSNP